MQSTESQLAYWNAFSVRHWYPALEQHTFTTRFIPIAVDLAKSIVTQQERLLQSPLAEITYEEDEKLLALEREIDQQIRSFESRGILYYFDFIDISPGAFARLSLRSPKDAATERGRIDPYLDHYLRDVDQHDGSNASALPAVYRAMMKALRVTSGREAMELYVDCWIVGVYMDWEGLL